MLTTAEMWLLECDVTLHAVCVQEDIAKLLRFESSALPAGQQTNLMEYASRMKAGTRNIYYLCAPNRHLAEHSPYYEAMKQKDMEVRRVATINTHVTYAEKSNLACTYYNGYQILFLTEVASVTVPTIS